MEVQIVFADNIDTNNNQNGTGGFINLINPTLAFALPVTPSALTFSAAVLTKGFDTTKNHSLEFKIVDADEIVVNKIAGEIPIQPMNPIETYNFNLNFRNVLFNKAGLYKLIFSVDDEMQGEQIFEVKDLRA